MRRHPTAIAAAALALLLAPALVAADDKDKKDPAPDAKKDDPTTNTEKTIKAGTVAGKVVGVNGTSKSLTIDITYEYAVTNEGEVTAVANAENSLRAAIARRDLAGVANAQRDIAYHQARTQKMERKTQKKDFTSTDDAKVRLTDPPPAYDDKGNIRKRTPEELRALKGDSKLPGYGADWNDLRQGDVVRLTLVKKKEVRHPDAKPKDDPKSKDAGADPLGDDAPEVSLIEILSVPMEKK